MSTAMSSKLDENPKVVSEKTGYVKFKEFDIVLGDMECSDIRKCQSKLPPSSPAQAMIVCDSDPACKAFSFLANDISGQVFFKSNLQNGLVKKSRVTTFVKKRHSVSLVVPGSCAVLVQETVASNQSNGCKLGEFDPFHPSIMKLIRVPDQPLKCPGRILSTYRNGTVVFHDKDNFILKSEYYSITRTPESDSDIIQSQLTLLDHKKPNQIDHEFIGIKTRTRDGQETNELHAAVKPKPQATARPPQTKGIPLNVMIIGIDSTSNAHFQRALPKAYKFLTEHLKSIVMKGYTIVGDGTTPALTAILTGNVTCVQPNVVSFAASGIPTKREATKETKPNENPQFSFSCTQAKKDLPEARRGFSGSETVDSWPWIFKDFKESGYATLFSDDEAFYGTYNYRLHGFKNPPTDHYGRPFWLAANITSPHCIHSKPQHLIHLEYLESFFDAYPNIPKFGLGFMSSVAHNNLNSIYYMADDFPVFLSKLERHLNNTILIVMSDHGLRMGEARATLQGNLEERLPFFSMTLPPWFHAQYPTLVSNLRHNTQVPTSPFDLHLTLRHLLSYPEVPKPVQNSFGSSMFEKIPNTRDCQSAGIMEHYCPCLSLKTADHKNEHIQAGAQAIVSFMNKLLAEDQHAASLCYELELKEIVTSYQQMPNTKFQQFKGPKDIHGRIPIFSDENKDDECNYQIQLITKPGDALFEAPIRVKQGFVTITGDISRLNKYGNQPQCILEHNRELRKYCLCKA